jgi:hypothetical protein
VFGDVIHDHLLRHGRDLHQAGLAPIPLHILPSRVTVAQADPVGGKEDPIGGRSLGYVGVFRSDRSHINHNK